MTITAGGMEDKGRKRGQEGGERMTGWSWGRKAAKDTGLGSRMRPLPAAGCCSTHSAASPHLRPWRPSRMCS